MFNIPKSKLVRRTLRIHNPKAQTLPVCIEPWAIELELQPGKTLDVVFVGRKSGDPEISPDNDQVVVYGWEESEVAVFQDGSWAIPQPSVEEIVQQELELMKGRIERTTMSIPADKIAWTHEALDKHPELTSESQRLACGLAAILILALAPGLSRSPAAVQLLWQIAARLVGTRGLALGTPEREKIESAIWNENAMYLESLISQQSVSMLPRYLNRDFSRRIETKPLRVESESGPMNA